ncbi:MAG: penicillin acylase family protein [Acidimicrobiia bacterium]|nr:penicillin acylase family protein [Acidimicrobiia bacterium]
MSTEDGVVEFDDGFDYSPTETGPRFRRTKTTLRWLATLLAVAIVLLVLFIIWSTRRPFPQVSGEIEITGLDGDVEIIRDERGIPHIYASTIHDLFLAQGFVHAQDRFWQMDTWRHIGAGRISEMFGEDQVETDAFLRTMGWAELAAQQYETTSALGRDALAGYVAGVNALIATRSPAELGFEYTVLELVNRNYTPEPWTAIDSILWGKVMAWDLRGNMEDEIARSFLLDDFAPQEVELFYPPYPEDHPLIVGNSESRVPGPGLGSVPLDAVEAIAQASANAALVDRLTGNAGVGIGSNSWVIGPELSATGAPILANDPHLGIRMPSIWYQVGLHCMPKTAACPFDVAGFSFAGMPGVIIGHNDRIAWGLTNLGPDVTDLYVERLNPDDPLQYEVNGRWVDMDTQTETIEVAGGEPVDVEVRRTRHGPIISDDYGILEDFTDNAGIALPDEYAIALRWTALDQNPSLIDAVIGLNRATDFDAFRDALRLFEVPSQNVIYADIDGNIGYQAPGRIPIRSNGDGRVPVPGWTSEFEWVGFIPFDELPYVYNPAEGYIATANNPVVDGSYPHLLTTDWNYGDRAGRIVEMIEADSSIDLDDVAAMQVDNFNRHAVRLLPWFNGVDLLGADGTVIRAAEILSNWDLNNDADSAGAAIFEAVWRNLLELTFHDDLEEDIWPTGGSRWSLAVAGMLDYGRLRIWDDQTTQVIETRDDILPAAFQAAVAELRDLLGDNPDEWAWGRIHGAVFRNETLGESGVGLIEARFNRGPFPVGGGSDIVNAVGWYADEGYEVTWIPSMRMIIDLGDLSNSRAMHTTGQSGHAYNSHYQDMIEPWAAGDTWSVEWDRADIELGAEGKLVLVPADGPAG